MPKFIQSFLINQSLQLPPDISCLALKSLQFANIFLVPRPEYGIPCVVKSKSIERDYSFLALQGGDSVYADQASIQILIMHRKGHSKGITCWSAMGGYGYNTDRVHSTHSKDILPANFSNSSDSTEVLYFLKKQYIGTHLGEIQARLSASVHWHGFSDVNDSMLIYII